MLLSPAPRENPTVGVVLPNVNPVLAVVVPRENAATVAASNKEITI